MSSDTNTVAAFGGNTYADTRQRLRCYQEQQDFAGPGCHSMPHVFLLCSLCCRYYRLFQASDIYAICLNTPRAAVTVAAMSCAVCAALTNPAS